MHGPDQRLALLGGAPVRSTPLPYGHQTIEPDDLVAVGEALRADWITQGPTVARFERAPAERAGVKHAVAVASATAALHAACRAAGLGPGDDVITTPLTFAATANAAVARGARPVFADIDGATLNMSPDAVKRVATASTRAVMTVDYAGMPCEYGRLLTLAREDGWTVIADAAHSFGGASGGRPVGALADMTTLSFHPVKLITTGEGGAVLTDHDHLAERLRAMRHHGIRYPDPTRPWRYEILEPGHNYRLSDFQSALGLSQLGKLDRFWEQRDRLARRYREQLGLSRFVELSALGKDAVPPEGSSIQTLSAGLRHPFYADRLAYAEGLCPTAEAVEPRLMTLPLFPAMTDADQDDVLHALDKVFAHYAR